MNQAQSEFYPVAGIGCLVAPDLRPVYREIGYLLGIQLVQLAWDGPGNHDIRTGRLQALLVDGIDLREVAGEPLVLVCGPVSGDNPALRKVVLPFHLGETARMLLMAGRDYRDEQAAEPTLDLMLGAVRRVLQKELSGWIELPPIPWGHSYAMALTHDLDILSLKEMPVGRTFLGYFYRSSVVNWRRWRQGKVNTGEFLRALGELGRTVAAKLGMGKDVWQRALAKLLQMERELGVRSSLYFMPFAGKAGIAAPKPASGTAEALHKRQVAANPGRISANGKAAAAPAGGVEARGRVSRAPANRASFYDVADYRELLQDLEAGGWETGVHGIDAWHDAGNAAAEHDRVAALSGRPDIGVRMHWLYWQAPQSFKALEDGGFLYDATFGYNEIAGFRAGTMQPYRPLNCERLWELPLHIQDGALLAEEHGDLSREDAYRRAEPVLDWAVQYGGAVSLLWHNQSFTAPRFWGEVYRRLIERGQQEQAWIATPREILRWFAYRRQCALEVTAQADGWVIECRAPAQPPGTAQAAALVTAAGASKGSFAASVTSAGASTGCTPQTDPAALPPLRVRLHVPPEQVKEMSVPFAAGDGFVDFATRAGERVRVTFN